MSSAVVPEPWAAQVAPPSVVASMVPPSPTAQPWEASGKATPRSNSVVPELSALQVAPPSEVARMVPLAPTAQPWEASRKVTSLRLLPCGNGFCQSQPPSPVEMNAGAVAATRASPS